MEVVGGLLEEDHLICIGLCVQTSRKLMLRAEIENRGWH